MRVGRMCSRAFSGVVLVQGMMLLQLYWNPYTWIRTPVIPFGIWTTSTLVHFGQLVSRVVFSTRGCISAIAAGSGGLSISQVSKKRLLFEIVWLGLGTCISYLLAGGWAERQQLHQTTANLELMLIRVQDLKERTRRQLEVGYEPSIGIEALDWCRREVRVYIRGTLEYFPEVVEVGEAIYLELTEAMGLIKMALEADGRRRMRDEEDDEGQEVDGQVAILPVV
ncbi:hypothetical protein BGZ91_002712 [Linnemannia elongata]|nr:hypothetical protein BGZ91_002712 [Linnemannia elongata]